jgi:hypothetical protein
MGERTLEDKLENLERIRGIFGNKEYVEGLGVKR